MVFLLTLLPIKKLVKILFIITKDGKSMIGFVTGESANSIVLRDITGAGHAISTKNIQTRKKQNIYNASWFGQCFAV